MQTMFFKQLTAATTLCFSLCASAGVLAQDDHGPTRGPGPGGHGHKPPPAAYEACTDLSAEDDCSVTFGKHTIAGTCTADDHEDGKLFCRPNHPPVPPPEALEACADKSAGDECSVTTPDDGQLSGTCVKGRKQDDSLVCRPSR
jgi:hypothetical protein